MSRPRHPRGTYVGLYGSHGDGWRGQAKELLDRAGVPWHDPTDSRWDGITHENGDRHQELIDELVAEELTGLEGAACVIFHLEGGHQPPASLAARVELGLLAGRGATVFVHLDPRSLGRNYVRAVVQRYPGLVLCESLEDAAARAATAIPRSR